MDLSFLNTVIVLLVRRACLSSSKVAILLDFKNSTMGSESSVLSFIGDIVPPLSVLSRGNYITDRMHVSTHIMLFNQSHMELITFQYSQCVVIVVLHNVTLLLSQHLAYCPDFGDHRRHRSIIGFVSSIKPDVSPTIR